MPKTVIEGPYLADLLDQPAALRRASAGLADIPSLREFKARRIVLTGMGSSQFALYPLCLRLIAHGFDARLVETAELIHYQAALLGGDGTLLVAASQSGRSAEIVRLMESAGPGDAIAAVTNDDASPLAARADFRLLLHAGAESTVSCKTYLNTLLVLDWLGALLTGADLPQKRAELDLAAAAAARYLADWRRRVDEWMVLADGVDRVFVTGRGPSLAAARTGGLILKESTRFAAEGMSCAAFRHGPLEAAGPRALVLICEGGPAAAPLNRALARDVKAAGGPVAILPWSPGPAIVSMSLEMLPVQMLSLALAAAADREAGRFENATKITAVE